MPNENAIFVEGRIKGVLKDGLFLAELTNGHQVVAHSARGRKTAKGTQGELTVAESVSDLLVGDVVTLEMSPYDMSKGRIRG